MTYDLHKNIIKSNKGQPKMAYLGYFYNLKECKTDVKIWRCNKRGCKSLLKTTITDCFISVLTHDHLADENKFNKVLLSNDIKQRSLDTEENSRDIIVKSISKLGSCFYDLKIKHLRALIGKTRKDKNLTIMKDYDIPLELQVTNDDKKFLYYDSGMEDQDRVIIFTTDENIRHYVFSKVIICDGTFRVAPSAFTQLYTIQCRVNNTNLPLIYCFMRNKKESGYNNLFQWLLNVTKDYNIVKKHFVLDFEIAAYNSINRYIKDAEMYGCSFHLGQIMWRQVQTKKMTLQYNNDMKAKLHIKMILSLAFVPIENVKDYALYLKNYLEEQISYELLIIYNWFHQEYLTQIGTNKDIKFWNVYFRTMNDIPRTTNSIEGYHRHLNNLVKHKQTSFHLILKELKSEQTLTEVKLLQCLYKTDFKVEDRMIVTMDLFGKLSPIDYLKRVSMSYNWNLNN
ncbi:hypothetical protein DMUE_4887 [Dictyocoela muelleri]|nr:hypothetical protein DMUE_4887 [Dictyocoela muelleri]